MISIVNAPIPHVERETRDGSSVKILLKYPGTTLEHKHHGCKTKTQQQNIYFRFFTLSTALAP